MQSLIQSGASKLVFNLEDYARHQTSGCMGKVVGYGHKILDSVYLPTLKVQVVKDKELEQGAFLEDVSSAWVRVEK
jgi:hypothetical protein